MFTYNPNGDLLSKSDRLKCDRDEDKDSKDEKKKSKDPTYINTSFIYDVFGNLKQAGRVTYQIDPLQRRSARLVNGLVTNKYIYNPEGQLIGELDKDNNLVKTFIYASKSHVPDYFVDSNNERFKLVVDQLGSVRLVVNSRTGEIKQKMTNDEFGKVIRDTKPMFQPFGFAGGLYDTETKLVRFGVRDYDPEVGRWTSKDPIRFNGGDTNLYGYVMADPINGIDPLGLDTWSIGFSGNFSGFGFSASGGVGFVTDGTNTGFYQTGGAGAGGAIANGSINFDIGHSNAGNIGQLNGAGYATGGSVTVGPGLGVTFGGGIFGGNGYTGQTGSIGLGTIGYGLFNQITGTNVSLNSCPRK